MKQLICITTLALLSGVAMAQTAAPAVAPVKAAAASAASAPEAAKGGKAAIRAQNLRGTKMAACREQAAAAASGADNHTFMLNCMKQP